VFRVEDVSELVGGAYLRQWRGIGEWNSRVWLVVVV
jgi:hypothetical protein